MFYLTEEKNIYCKKTREYFKEVMSCYSNGNYRSAIVMLYSIAICDLLYKLQELKDIYNDSIATKILEEVERSRNSYDLYTKAKWEKELVDKIFKNTELIDLQAYTELNHLYDYRNFSAHPSMNEDYELITPSREVTIALINCTLTNILVKPPLFAKRIIDMLSEDVAEKKEIYHNDPDSLKEYLNNKYIVRMSDSMRKSTFKALWKFCFILSDDEKCIENRYINRKVLEFLYESIPNINDFMKGETIFKSTSSNNDCLLHLNRFLANYPEVYPLLSDDTHLLLTNLRTKNVSVDYSAWYESENKVIHLKELIAREKLAYIKQEYLVYIESQYYLIGQSELFLDFCIKYFSCSTSYDDANCRYWDSIKPHLSEFNRNQFIRLIQSINANQQIYGRNSAKYTNSEVYAYAKETLGEEFNINLYNNFKYEVISIPDPDLDDLFTVF